MRCKNGNHSCNSCGEKKCGNKHTTCHNADVVEVRHGFWDRRYSKHIDHLGEFLKYEGDFCSICGAMGNGKYCSECGAKMDGERSKQ